MYGPKSSDVPGEVRIVVQQLIIYWMRGEKGKNESRFGLSMRFSTNSNGPRLCSRNRDSISHHQEETELISGTLGTLPLTDVEALEALDERPKKRIHSPSKAKVTGQHSERCQQ